MSFHGGMLLHEDILYVGTDGDAGLVYAFDILRGVPLWKYNAGTDVMTDLFLCGPNVHAVARADEGRAFLLALDSQTGAEVWKQPVHAAAGPPYVINKSPVLHEGRIFYGGADGQLYAFDPDTGETVFKKELGSPVITSLAAHDGRLYMGLESGSVVACQAGDGKIVATIDLGGKPGGPPTLSNSFLYLFREWTRPDGALVRLDSSLSRIQWARNAPDGTIWISARPFPNDGEILLGNEKGTLIALDEKSGEGVWSLQLDGSLRIFSTHGEWLFVGTIEGKLFALRRDGSTMHGLVSEPTPSAKRPIKGAQIVSSRSD